MKNAKLLIWLTQLGLSVAVPPVGFIALAVWLRDSCGWGGWVIWAGIILGVFSAVEGLRASIKAMELISKDKKKGPPPISYNDHD